METRIILTVGSILLGSGCIGLLIVRLSNPFFKGLEWLGCSFAVGGVGAALLSGNIDGGTGPVVLGAYSLILLAYVFLHVCILEITDHKTRLPKLGIALVGIQTAAYPVYAYFHRLRELSIVTLGLLLAVQALQTALHLKKSARANLQPHLWFSILLLVGFAGYNIFRSVAVLIVGTPQNPLTPNPYEVLTAVVFLSAGLGLGFGVFWIISAEIRLKLEQLANTDPLTGLYNRRSFRSWCEREQLISTRTGEHFSLILLDLDDFKQINDRYGHDAGDAALCAVVERLRHGIRNIDVLGRWGGEEFVALLPGAGADAAALVAERLRGSVANMKISQPVNRTHTDGAAFALTISLGVATYVDSSDTIDDLLRRCDQALYQAKANGRNRVIQANA